MWIFFAASALHDEELPAEVGHTVTILFVYRTVSQQMQHSNRQDSHSSTSEQQVQGPNLSLWNLHGQS